MQMISNAMERAVVMNYLKDEISENEIEKFFDIIDSKDFKKILDLEAYLSKELDAIYALEKDYAGNKILELNKATIVLALGSIKIFRN